jgi:hypothetical protein
MNLPVVFLAGDALVHREGLGAVRAAGQGRTCWVPRWRGRDFRRERFSRKVGDHISMPRPSRNSAAPRAGATFIRKCTLSVALPSDQRWPPGMSIPRSSSRQCDPHHKPHHHLDTRALTAADLVARAVAQSVFAPLPKPGVRLVGLDQAFQACLHLGRHRCTPVRLLALVALLGLAHQHLAHLVVDEVVEQPTSVQLDRARRICCSRSSASEGSTVIRTQAIPREIH